MHRTFFSMFTRIKCKFDSLMSKVKFSSAAYVHPTLCLSTTRILLVEKKKQSFFFTSRGATIKSMIEMNTLILFFISNSPSYAHVIYRVNLDHEKKLLSWQMNCGASEDCSNHSAQSEKQIVPPQGYWRSMWRWACGRISKSWNVWYSDEDSCWISSASENGVWTCKESVLT